MIRLLYPDHTVGDIAHLYRSFIQCLISPCIARPLSVKFAYCDSLLSVATKMYVLKYLKYSPTTGYMQVTLHEHP